MSTPIFVPILGTVFVGFLLYVVIKFLKLRSDVNRIPGPWGIPILGNSYRFAGENAVDMLKTIISMVEECSCQATGWMRVWLGYKPYIFGFSPEVIEPILSSSKHIEKSSEYEFFVPWLGRGLLISKGQKWSYRRKLLTPSFHFKILEDFTSVMTDRCKIFEECLLEAANKNPAGFNIAPYVSRMALDIICETAMGVCVDAQTDPGVGYYKDVARISEILFYRGLKPWLWPNLLNYIYGTGFEEQRLLKRLHNFTVTVIKDRRKSFKVGATPKRADGKKVRLSFLDTLISVPAPNELSDEDIREEVDTFMFEGHDTTAAGISWAISLIGAHEDVQRKVQQEIDRVCSDAEDADDLSQDDLRKMTYLECVIKESLRLYPSVPFYLRSIREDIVYKDGKMIPAGAYFNVVPYLLHRNPAHWPDPEKFDPDRFNPVNSVGRHPYAYVPFSAGPRNCIGQKFALLEEKLAMVTVLRKFNVETLMASTPRPDVILKPDPGVFVRVWERTG